nr:putative squalene-hopene synthease [Cibotium barometz]
MLPYHQDFFKTSLAMGDHGRGSTAGEATVDEAIKRSQDFLLSQQFPEGYWWAALDSNVSFTAETVLLYKVLGINDGAYPMHKMLNYLRKTQCSHGAWELFYGDGGDLSITVEAYMALCLLGIPKTDPSMEKASEFILRKGGADESRCFTKLCLAMLGCYSWAAIPSLPPWLMLLPSWFITSIYELASWARATVVPLVVIYDKKPVFQLSPAVRFDELYVAGGRKNTFRFQGNWTDIFIVADYVLKLAERFNMVPFRQWGVRQALKWVIERQEEHGDWSGIFSPMLLSMLCMKVSGYGVSDPMIHRGLKALRDFTVETEDVCWVQMCVSPVWDTALVVRSLVESSLPSDHPALQLAGEWLLSKQITGFGDWSFKNKRNLQTGAWSFEFFNKWYPDVEDTAAVVMALEAIRLPPTAEPLKHGAMARAVKWITSMQCKAGGWASFDKDNNQVWFNSTPYGDLKALVDPNTADITARVLDMVGVLSKGMQQAKCGRRSSSDGGHDQTLLELPPSESTSRALAYLRKEQEREGCWFGRWGVNYIYGTSGVLVALAEVAPATHQGEIARGARWLVQVQNKDQSSGGYGGWGETCQSYTDPSLKGQGESTPSQTAWALMGLLAAGEALGKYEINSIEAGVRYLLLTQRQDGSWHDACFTGTAFPGHFFLKYHLFAQHFPLTALARYRTARLDKPIN